ncbi:MAG: type II secretion system F family protein [Deltaproteobacteria bacterium]|nr:type II secretion system F family protein [Deltaproteobacteria bacterium]
MPSFQYRARDRQGVLVVGNMDAASKTELETSLDKMGLIPISVAAGGRKAALSPFMDALFKQKVNERDIILFSRQLSTLFGAGVPLTRALFTLERQIQSKEFVEIVKKIREDVEGGSSFSAAIARHPKVFGELYANMIEAGEAGGILDNVLDKLAFMFEKNAENRAKVKAATLYPKIVLGAIVIAVVILMNFVIPKFAKLYESFKVELPLPTRILIKASNAFTSYWYLAIVAVAAAVLGWRAYVATKEGRRNWDAIRLKVPIFGPLILKSILSRFSRVLGALYKSGLPILQSLDIVSRAVENTVLAQEIKKIEDEVRAGKGLAEPISKAAHFPPMVVQMVTVGEDTGNLDQMLDKVAEYYDSEVDNTIRNLTTTLEPVLLGFIFVIVLFIALAIFLPMWDILKIVRR